MDIGCMNEEMKEKEKRLIDQHSRKIGSGLNLSSPATSVTEMKLTTDDIWFKSRRFNPFIKSYQGGLKKHEPSSER